MNCREQEIARICRVVIILLVIGLASLFALMGCATTKPLTGDSFPPQIAGQCNRAKAEAIRKWGQPPMPFWSVTQKRGDYVRGQWAFMQGGRLVGGHTSGCYTVIGCGPNGEINYGDLLHEAGEYATWRDGRMHQ